MKRVIALLAVFVLTFALLGCSESVDDHGQQEARANCPALGTWYYRYVDLDSDEGYSVGSFTLVKDGTISGRLPIKMAMITSETGWAVAVDTTEVHIIFVDSNDKHAVGEYYLNSRNDEILAIGKFSSDGEIASASPYYRTEEYARDGAPW
jgi:hypothetical protein